MAQSCCHNIPAKSPPYGLYSLLSLLLSIPLHFLSMGHSHFPYNTYVQLLISGIVVFYFGFPILNFFWKSLQSYKPDMFTLLGSGILIAYLYSLFGLFFIDPIPSPLFFDASAAITTLVLAGQWIEQRSEKKLSSALKNLLSLTPPTARLLTHGSEKIIPLSEVRPGQHLLYRDWETDRKSTRLNSSHSAKSRMPSSA